MKRLKKFFQTKLFYFILGIFACGTVSVWAQTYFPSNNVSYDNKTSGLESTDVQGAIDELYNTCFPPKSGSDTITELVPSNSGELYEDEHGDIRYYGKAPNNYVSFNNELWRIIGVIDGKLKIIRNKSIGNMQWASNNSNNWNNASLKSYLNGEYYNSINETYKKMISEETYYLGGPTDSNETKLTASGYYNEERSSTVNSGHPMSIKQYIGLMYPSDYGYAAGNSCLSTSLWNYYKSCKNNDYLSIGKDEWLQSPKIGYNYLATHLNSNGYVNYRGGVNVTSSSATRPVLYLNTNVQIIGGDGSQSNPFQLSL